MNQEQTTGCGVAGPAGYACTHHENGEHVARGTEPDSVAEAWPIFERTPRPTSSMWGQCDQTKEIAPGIWQVSTPGHGGLILSRQRMAALPRIIKSTHGSCQFEEDCDWALVALAFPDCFSVATQYQARRTIAATADFGFPGFNPEPWKRLLEAYPLMYRKDQTRETRIELVLCDNAWSFWSKHGRDMTKEEAAVIVHSGEDLKKDQPREVQQ